MNKMIWLLVSLILLTVGSVTGQEGKAGYAGAFFYVPIGARPTAMGGAYTAISDDGGGALFNPAGLANIKRMMFSTSYRVMKLDRVLGYASLLVPAKGDAAIGVHWLYAGDKNLAARDHEGRELGFDISKNDHVIAIVFAKRFEKLFSAGIKINYMQSSFVDLSAFAVGFDFGMMFYLSELMDRESRDLAPVQDIRGGFTVKYLGAKYRWNSENFVLTNSNFGDPRLQEDKIPLEVALGLSARFLDRSLLLATDIKKNEKQSPFFHAGAEYLPKKDIALRGGYSAGRLTAGAGYIFSLGKNSLAIDYAFSTDKADEGSEHIFSFDLLF